MRSRRRYKLGDAPCGRCQAGAHLGCRPRLDNSLCSCSCERAAAAQEEFNRKSKAAEQSGLPQPSIAEALQILYPKIRELSI